jgi:hypothetical protein
MTRFTGRKIVLATLLILTVPSVAGRTQSPRLPASVAKAVSHYASVRSNLTRRRGRESVERLFSAARELKAALLRGHGDEVVIEQLTAHQFEDVVARVNGVIVNREELLVVEPDAQLFLTLARTYGTRADTAFAEAYAATYPDSLWPSYVSQVTDVTACTEFGTGELVARYRQWLSFRSQYAHVYRDEALAQLRRIEDEVAGSDCACGSAADVLAELEEFAVAFPDAPIAEAVKGRLAAVRGRQSPIRFGCLPN